MKTTLLFPNKLKPMGWVIAIPSMVLGIIYLYMDMDMFGNSNFTLLGEWFASYIDEMALVGTLVGLMLIGFSKLKIEDEYSQKIRLDSLLWATYLNVGLLILATLFIYGDLYFDVIIYNLITLPLFFVIRFHVFLARR